ncbi:MAG: IPT/TIG domain-containing protein [Patescibacteria group bacterium]|nr:IPT/TIG domain-containing protein [bacterium]HQC50019.1 IPT/TIG domain-containing protein [bacterium]
MARKVAKKILSLLIIVSGLVFFRLVLAQDFGAEALNEGLGGTLGADDPRTIFGRIVNIALGFLGVIALLLMLYAGFLWMTSGGDEEKIRRAKKTLIRAAIGLIIIFSSWAIVSFLISRLGGASNPYSGGGVCVDGETIPCGCGGSMVCVNNRWSGCVGSDCGGGANVPTACDSSTLPGCQANHDICAPEYFCDNNCTCRPRGNIGDPCDANLENNTCDAEDIRCARYLACDQETCLCFGPPVITGFSPAGGFCEDNPNRFCRSDANCDTTCNQSAPNGAPNNLITIFGRNFGEYDPNTSRVIFLGGTPREGRNPSELNPVCVNFWSDTQIIIAVPQNVDSGPIRVIRADGLEDQTDNDYGPSLPNFVANTIVRPGLCLLTPGAAHLSDQISYQGINLYSGEAYFGNYRTNVSGLNSNFSNPGGLAGTTETPNIRAGDTTSFVVSSLGGNLLPSNYLQFTKISESGDGPFIISFSPSAGVSGQYITILGSGFGWSKGDSKVFFESTEASYDFPVVCANSVWSDNQVIVKVPDGLSNGNYLIRMQIDGRVIDTEELNPNVFTYDDTLPLRTSICKLEPNRGNIGTSVKVYGEYFGLVGYQGLARFYSNRDVSAYIGRASDADLLNVNVPAETITGPVRVIRAGQWGNELNFEVRACQNNDDCPGQVCCPGTTYRSGQCVNALAECYSPIPNSIYEWSFSTGLGAPTEESESCQTLARYHGSCQTGAFCPNVPGVCSPYPGGNRKIVGQCDFSCSSVAGCGGLGAGTCSYNADLNRCIQIGADGLCDPEGVRSYVLGEQTFQANFTCNQNGNWQFAARTSCPDGWERTVNNICIDLNSSCASCATGLTCTQVGNESRCASNSICPQGSICVDNPDITSADNCVKLDDSSCDCCCRISNSEQDCCVPLECRGTCGQDQTDDGAGYGRCTGCARVGTTQAEHDAACNCFGHSGQYCSISSENPEGICTDCSGLTTQADCAEHSSACCFDSKRTVNTADDVCRGGSGTALTNDSTNPDYGYCAYYNCFSETEEPIGDPALCAVNNPLKIGYYRNSQECEQGCSEGGAGNDFCALFNNRDECAQAGCCFDFNTSRCRGGEAISSGTNLGYCAYYNCLDLSVPGLENYCDTTPVVSGRFGNLNSCNANCNAGGGGAGLDCSSRSSLTECNFDICTFPGMACLVESGAAASSISDCGICCCNTADPTACQTELAPNLYCQANQGRCTGANRGLCCGCTSDAECGSPELVGCGFDTCCQARPNVIETMPQTGDTNICRNASLRVVFDRQMDVLSFGNNNVVLLQEVNYGEGTCPSGTIALEPEVEKNNNKNLIARLFNRVKYSIGKLFKVLPLNNSAMADLPDPNRLYCLTPINISGDHLGEQTIAEINPTRLLAPDTKYFLIIKGDENLNSQSGVLSLDSVGLNGQGIYNEGIFVEGANLLFNNKRYPNSHVVQFRTLSDKLSNSGICAIDSVRVSPVSYLFKTTTNSLDENDTNANIKTFDTVHDRDKVFVAQAYSADGQIIQPVTGYFWEWRFNLEDPSVASISNVTNLARNKAFVSAREGITDSNTRLIATVNMDRFLNPSSSISPTCVCSDELCSSNCRNAFSEGDNSSNYADLYVFICENPWPAVYNGLWAPYRDNCSGAIGACSNFNYSFYYCRDAGQPGTHDDLPAIINRAVIVGQSSNLVCSLNSAPCSSLNSPCGDDRNGDGIPDGICIWSVLKESYFFREELPSVAEIISATDTTNGGEVTISWNATSAQAASYKIYYGEAGKAVNNYLEVSRSTACATSPCRATVTGLKNNQLYVFRLSSVSANKAESILSSERSATPTDQTAPQVPTNFNYEDLGDSIRFTWNRVDADANYYRLYRGIISGLYGESYDSTSGVTSLTLEKNRLSTGQNYFTVSALDRYNNESNKSAEIVITIN